MSVGCLPVSRFLLASIGILSTEHQSNSISLVLNNGLLALTQSLLRLIGKCNAILLPILLTFVCCTIVT